MRMKLPFPLQLPTAILGLGISGKAVFKLLIDCGISKDQIFLFDQKSSENALSGHAILSDIEDLKKFGIKSFILSPGLAKSSPWIQDFLNLGGQVTSELEIASSFLTTEKVITVTGSVGKSTTVSLLGAGLAEFCSNYFVGGNLGLPLADYALKIIAGAKPADWVVLELSSFQLETFSNLSASASAITSLTPNHLERYADLNHYYDTKLSLIEKTLGPIFLSKPGGDLFDFYQKKSSALDSQKSHLTIFSTKEIIWCDVNEFQNLSLDSARLIGRHNQANLVLVSKIAERLEWPVSARKGFCRFSGLEHRLQDLGIYNGIRFINDSKATAIDSVLQAVVAVTENSCEKNWILLGGRDKNLPWHDLAHLKNLKNSEFVFFGECANLAQQKSKLSGSRFINLAAAMDYVLAEAKPKDCVLLSPGGTSLDEFKSFEHRGNYFKDRILKHLKNPDPSE